MKKSYTIVLFLILNGLFYFLVSCSSVKNINEKWQPLFANVEGQVNYELRMAKLNNYADEIKLHDLFDIKGDSIMVLYNWEGENAPFAVIASKKSYSNYDLRFEYKWGTRKFKPRKNLVRDAGLLFHMYDYSPKTFPRSLECQVQENDTGDLWVLGGDAMPIAEDGSDKPLEVTDRYSKNSKRYVMNEVQGWNQVLIIVRGNSASFFVNDKLVNRVESATKLDTTEPLNSGFIGFQAEGAEVIYRNIRIREL